MAVINQFSNFHTNNLHWLNSTNIALIPKKGAKEVANFDLLVSFMLLQSWSPKWWQLNLLLTWTA
jgi:hypothetical protein